MTTLASPTPLPSRNDARAELEPDKAWKDALRAKIEDGLSSMVEDAKKNYRTELRKGTTSDARREVINREYEEAMNNIRTLAQETFTEGLQRERQERRWAAGVDMCPGWNEALVQEQQGIMNRIKGARKGTQSPSVAERSLAERPIDNRHVVELSSYSFSSRNQDGPIARNLAKEQRETSLDRLEQGLLTSQPPSDMPATPEQQRQQEEKARLILERKERERKEWERQEKADHEKEKIRKAKEEETKERLKEQERAWIMEMQLLEREHAEKERQDRERAEKERQHLEKQRREWERAEKERLEKQRQIEKGILERQRLDNERKKELEKEKKGREEREVRERRAKVEWEREERERVERETEERETEEKRVREEKERERQEMEREREREETERERQEMERQEREREKIERERQEREREKIERERQEMEMERQEMERHEMENARLDRERWERGHLDKLKAARVQEEREQKERWKREEEEEWEREKATEIQIQRNRQREYVQETQVHDHPQFPLERNLPQSNDSDFSDTCDTDDLELLSPPSTHPIPTRKQTIHERPLDPTRSIDNFSRLSPSTDRPVTRSPPMIWKPSSVEDDASTKPLTTELGRRSSIASIKSTGSGGVRPIIVDDPIPERSDSEAEYLDKNTRFEDWHPMTKSRERERRREYRKNSASDGLRSDESYVPLFPNARVSHRVEDSRPLPPRDRYDNEQSYRSLRYHRSEEIPNHPSSSLRAPLRREASFYEEHDDKYHSSRSIRARTSFEDRGGPYQPPQVRGPSRPSSTLNDERDYYDQAGYRSYPTPPSSASRPSIRDHMTPPGRYPSGPPYGYSSEPRSNTLKYAQQSESPLSRRSSESRPSMNRGPSFTQNYSEEPSPLHASTSEPYSRTYERAASASIPISARQHRSSYGSEETDGWRSWLHESPPFRREARREPERRDRYDQDRDEFQDTEYSSRNGREYEFWHPDPYPYYGPHPEPPRRKGYSIRSPMASHPGSYHDGPDHSFGERDRAYEVLYDTDGFIDDMDTEAEPISRYRDVPRQRREDNQRSALLDEEERNRWEAEDWRRRMAEEKKRYASEEEEARRREAKQEAMKWKETKRQATETVRLDDDTWQRGDELRRQAVEARKAKEEAIRIAEEVRIQAEEARKKEEEAIKKEEEVLRRAMDAKRKEEEAKLKEEEAKRKEEEAKKKEEEAKKKEEEAKKKEEEVHRQAEEARKKEEEVRRKEVAAKEEARRVREEAWKREQDMKYWEEELKQKEEELRRREREIEAERLQKEGEETRKEAERLQKQLDEEGEQRRLEEQRKREERFRYEQQQEEFRRREQEIHERKRQDSMGGSFPSSYASSPTHPARSYPSPSATGITGQTSGWSSSPKPGTASKASSSASAASKSRSGSINTSFPTSTPSPHPPPTFDEAEFKRRQEEFSQQQQEKFRRDQLRFEETRQRTESSKLSSEQVLSILERHDRQWSILTSSSTSLHWGSIPWPMFFPPQSPEDITLSTVTAYLQSPLLPDREKAKPQKDRLKEMIKKWHPDRFETKYLPRIIEGDREKVKEGTGVVIRLLNELLTKVNTPNPFGSS